MRIVEYLNLTFSFLRQLRLVVLLALAEELIELKSLMGDNERHVDLARDPIVDLETSGIDEENVGEGRESSGSSEQARISACTGDVSEQRLTSSLPRF